MVKVIIDKEKFRDMFHACGIENLETIVSLIRERIDGMIKRVVDLIKMYETDPELKTAHKAIDVWYETKKRIENIKI